MLARLLVRTAFWVAGMAVRMGFIALVSTSTEKPRDRPFFKHWP